MYKAVKVLWVMLMLFHHWMSVCPNRDKCVPLWRSDSAASYCIHIWFLLFQSVFSSLPFPHSQIFPDITPLVHVAEHSDMLINERSVFPATTIYLGINWKKNTCGKIFWKKGRTNMHFPQVQCHSTPVSSTSMAARVLLHNCNFFCNNSNIFGRMFLFLQIAILLYCTRVHERDMGSRCTLYEVMLK